MLTIDRRAIGLVVFLTLASAAAVASSHREAPFIATQPTADSTDVYAFVSYETGRADRVVLVANYIPFEEPSSQPNLYPGANGVTYEIKIDNTGDGFADLTFSFRFDTQHSPHLVQTDDGTFVDVPLAYNHPGPINDLLDGNLGLFEPYTIELTADPGGGPTTIPLVNQTLGGTTFFKPLDNAGTTVIPNYTAYANQHIFDLATSSIPGFAGRVFVGQREDPFVINYGAVYDFGNWPTSPTANSHAGHSVTSFILELPIDFLNDGGASPNIGVWSTARVPQNRAINPSPTYPGDVVLPQTPGAPTVQVSRLGMPLTNKLLIGVYAKDRFNALDPLDDLFEFDLALTNPAVAELMNAPSSGRNDVLDFFLKGLAGVNLTGGLGDMLRLNTTIAPVAAAAQDPMGIFGTPPDPAGFPNGRRPGDDVVDITLQVFQGRLLGGPGPFDAGDGVSPHATQFKQQFPFLNDPAPADASPFCVFLTSSTSPDRSTFAPVAGTHVDPAQPDRIVTDLPPEDLVFFLLNPGAAPSPASISGMLRNGDRLDVIVGVGPS